MTIEIRKAIPEDAAAILEISSQIWDGTDYVPKVLNKWLQDDGGTLWCALMDNTVLGFSRSTYLSGGRCWLEGIRVSPAARGLGLGKAMAAFQLKEAFEKGYKRCCLSSYIENYESLHIVRSNGFEETAQFKIYDWLKTNEETSMHQDESNKTPSEGDYKEVRKAILVGCKVVSVGKEEEDQLIEAISNSEMLKLRSGYLSYDWTFEVYSPEWVSKCITDGDFYRLESDKGSTYFSFSSKHVKGKLKTLNLVTNGDLETEVLAYCIEQAHDSGFESFCYMAYNNDKDQAFKEIGLETYNDFSQDVFVLEKKGRD